MSQMSKQIYPDISSDLMLSIARERLGQQLSSLDALDAKMAQLFVAGSGLLGLLAAILALRPTQAGIGGWIALAFAGAAFAVVAYQALKHLDPRQFDAGVDVDVLWNDHFRQDEHSLRWETTASYLCYYDQNRPKYVAKVKAVQRAVLAVTIESAALVAGLVLVAVTA